STYIDIWNMGKHYARLAIARPLHRLTAVKVARTRAPGMYADGGSLYLRIAPGGSKQYVFRYIRDGRLHDMGIGPTHTLTLVEARERATEARKLLLDGIDPLQAKRARFAALRAADASAVTFRQCAEDFIKANEVKWTNAQHRREWSWSLRKYVYPILGSMPVAAIDTPLVLRVLKPIWEKTPESASLLKDMHEVCHSDYIFPGSRHGYAMGKNQPGKLMKKLMGDAEMTVHGFRSSFRDWAAERTNFPREVAEMALAHAIPNAVEAAYRRGDL